MRAVSLSIYPRLAYRNEVAALEFLTRAFGLTERREARMEHPEGMLAWLEIGDGVVMIGRAGEDHHGLYSPLDAGVTDRHGQCLRRTTSTPTTNGPKQRAPASS